MTTGLPAHNPCRVYEGCYSAALVFNLRCAGSQRSLQRGRIFRIAWRRKYLGSRREGCRHQRKGRCNEARACQHGRMQGVFRREHPPDRRGTELRNHLLGNQNLESGRRTVRVERVGENLARDVKADAPIPAINVLTTHASPVAFRPRWAQDLLRQVGERVTVRAGCREKEFRHDRLFLPRFFDGGDFESFHSDCARRVAPDGSGFRREAGRSRQSGPGISGCRGEAAGRTTQTARMLAQGRRGEIAGIGSACLTDRPTGYGCYPRETVDGDQASLALAHELIKARCGQRMRAGAKHA